MRRVLLGFILGLMALPLSAGASGLWVGHPTTIESPFHRAWRHQQGCGSPTSGITYGYYGAAHQRFAHCSMTFGRVYVTHFGMPTATPRPRPTGRPTTTVPVPPSPVSTGEMPTAVVTVTEPPPSPNATATDWPPPPTPTPIPAADHRAACGSGDASACAAYLVELINAERAQYGYAPLSLDAVLTNGTGSCIGAVGHALHMANDLHTIAHDQFPADVCSGPYNAKGENVGVSAYGSLLADVDTIHSQMQAEPYSPGCSGNHHCTWMSPTYTRVGIAIVPGTFQGYAAHYDSEEYSN